MPWPQGGTQGWCWSSQEADHILTPSLTTTRHLRITISTDRNQTLLQNQFIGDSDGSVLGRSPFHHVWWPQNTQRPLTPVRAPKAPSAHCTEEVVLLRYSVTLRRTYHILGHEGKKLTLNTSSPDTVLDTENYLPSFCRTSGHWLLRKIV